MAREVTVTLGEPFRLTKMYCNFIKNILMQTQMGLLSGNR